MSDLPGFENVYGEGPAHPGLEEREPPSRLKAVKQNQLLLRPLDVENLVPLDHEVRAIWEFTGQIDLIRTPKPPLPARSNQVKGKGEGSAALRVL
jgi:hypothetical protein